MNKIQQRVLAGTVCATAALFAGTASADHDTFFFNYGHTFVYSAFDSDADDGDISANTIDFGVQLNEQFRLGAYHEIITGEGGSENMIRGLLAEYMFLGGGDFATSVGIMLGKEDEDAASVADIFGRFSLQAAENAEMFAKVAYRSAHGDWDDFGDPDDPDDLHGVYANLGFGFSF
ncbi:hypothetical protein HH1059_17740 [Halorhodospira halochloris]|uniref:Outer membrane protein beta-barrel domain-containing protein n=1 Tax=Halorhodospira halochloris TaxID=1052 RepID=A0A0X8XAG4_HALHR|nr:hypothetical protein [Halorhodospira halochloris]MBK1651600.1 hypothetical protein [Halorhodospira halochloris]BAU58461.1 hypothetical protein HH1059_17740 [Halorhodospira halochloris]